MNARAQFADLSSNNDGTFDAQLYADWGAVLLGNKATEGTGYTNPLWLARTEEAHKAHVSCLHYHYATPGDPVAQANYFLDTLERSFDYQQGHDRIALDLERGAAVPDPIPFLHAFNARCDERGHKALKLYSEESMFAELGPDFCLKAGLWIADFGALPPGWWMEHLFAHQETESATVPGCPGPVDRSTLSHEQFDYFRTHRP